MPDIYVLTTSAAGDAVNLVLPRLASAGLTGYNLQVVSEIPSKKAAAIIAMGSDSLVKMQDAKVFKKGRAIASLRGTVGDYFGSPCFVTYSPGLIYMEAHAIVDISLDVGMVARFLKTGTIEPEIGDYSWVTTKDLKKHKKRIMAQIKKDGKVEGAFDLETVGLDRYVESAYIVSFQFSTEIGKGYGFHFPDKESADALGVLGKESNEVWEFLDWYLNEPNIIMRGANLKYDLLWIDYRWGLECSNFKFDSTVVGSLFNENIPNTLNVHAKLYSTMGGYDDNFNSTHDKSKMHEVSPEDLRDYACGDADAELRVASYLKQKLIKDPVLRNFYVKLHHPAIRAFEKIEKEGLYVDREYYDQLELDITGEMGEAAGTALKCISNFIKAKYNSNFSLGRDVVIRDYLFKKKNPKWDPKDKESKEPRWINNGRSLNITPLKWSEKKQEPSTALGHLLEFKDHPKAGPFIAAYSEWKKKKKLVSTYVVGFKKCIKPDGKFHPSYILHSGEFGSKSAGSTSGRLAAKDPAINTTPKRTKDAKRLRRAVIAPLGWLLLALDYSQVELRMCAWMANELNMLQAYRDGKDIHALTAARLCNMSYDVFMRQDPDFIGLKRFHAKAVNFGFIYGMREKSFREYAKANYDLELTLHESGEWREAFFDLYPLLPDWHDAMEDQIRSTLHVRSIFGRVRHLPLANVHDFSVSGKQIRSGTNFRVQGSANDLTLWAISIMSKTYPELRMCLSIHDEIAAYVREDELVPRAIEMRDVMENLPFKEVFGLNPPVNFLAEAEAGQNWADMKELKL